VRAADVPVARRQRGTQRPAAQACIAEHGLPQKPQWAPSVWRSRHALPQRVSPRSHGTKHIPWEHTSPSAQTSPQRPQLLASFRGSTQRIPAPASSPPQVTRPQTVSPAAQPTTQLPLEQTEPAGQAQPQAPQCLRSV